MPIALGTHDKRQVRLAAGLLTVVGILSAWEIQGAMRHSPAHALQRPVNAPKIRSAAKPVKNADWPLMGFHLRIDELARSENVDYSLDGKDVFSTGPISPIEPVLAPPRPVEVTLPPPPAPPEPPPMDLKYLGFAVSDPGKLNALFMHGGDIYMAKTGDIMFHRFRVGVIQESHVNVTDLTNNNAQDIPAAFVAAN